MLDLLRRPFVTLTLFASLGVGPLGGCIFASGGTGGRDSFDATDTATTDGGAETGTDTGMADTSEPPEDTGTEDDDTYLPEDTQMSCPATHKYDSNADECQRRSCMDDGCGADLVCHESRCFHPEEVCNQLNCKRGVCAPEEGTCINADNCMEDGECIDGYYCGEEGNCLESQCKGSCLRGVCDPATGECGAADNCKDDRECPRQHYCDDGNCTRNEHRWTCKNPVDLTNDGQTVTHNTMSGTKSRHVLGGGDSDQYGDIVYRLELQYSSFIRFSIDPDRDPSGHQMDLRKTCDDVDSAIVGTNAESLEEVLEPGTYYIVVGGTGVNPAGRYKGTFEKERFSCTDNTQYCYDEETLIVCDRNGEPEVRSCSYNEKCNTMTHKCE